MNIGTYHTTILEAKWQDNKNLWTNETLNQIATRKGIFLLTAELDGPVTMGAGGDMVSWDELLALLPSVSLKLGEDFIFEEFSGADLAKNARILPPGDKEFWSFDGVEATPQANATGNAHVVLPLLYADGKYRGGEKFHRYASELIQAMEISVETASASAVTNLASIDSGFRLRIRAYGIEASKRVCAPIPRYRRQQAVTQKYALNDNKENLRAVAAYSSEGFAAQASEQDKVTIAGEFYYRESTTVGDLERAQDVRRRARMPLSMDRALIETNTTTAYPTDHFLFYLDPHQDLGDSPFKKSQKVELIPGSSRDLHMVGYMPWTTEQINKVAKAAKFSVGLVETLSEDGVRLEGLGENEVVTLPISFGEYGS